MLRNHLLICSILLLLCVPVFMLDHYSSKSTGGNWITLDFSNVLIQAYAIFIAIDITISTLAIIYYCHFSLFKTHLFSAILSLGLIAFGFLFYNKVNDYSYRKKQGAITQQRKSYFNDIRLKQWWFIPDEKNPKEIHVDLAIAPPGRLVAQVRGYEDGENGTNIFSSDGEAQRLVKAGEMIHYVFPLTINHPGKANKIEFTFHLFKHPFGESGIDDVSKIFKDSIDTNDDGTYFYEKLLPSFGSVPK